jgi:nucleoside 2-deoxyribosyltransferase
MTDYTVLSRFRNKEAVESLIRKLEEKGKTSHNFCAVPADPNNPDAPPEEQMKAYEEADRDFYTDPHLKFIFERDLNGLKNADTVLLLLPAGTSAHIEAGIAYGLGKPLVLIGTPEKPESLYLIFKERYATADEFLASL